MTEPLRQTKPKDEEYCIRARLNILCKHKPDILDSTDIRNKVLAIHNTTYMHR